MRSLAALTFASTIAVAVAPVMTLHAQGVSLPSEVGGGLVAAGEQANYLRARSLLDTTQHDARVPWAFQPFTGATADRLRALDPRLDSIARPRVDALLIHNTALPVGMNDGVLWAGRGVTMAVQGGLATTRRWGGVRLRAQLAPIAFYAANADFDIVANGRTGPLAYNDPVRPIRIDLPQRFGADPYARLDLGDSFLEVEALGLATGVSTARQHWGPSRDYPLVLSTNAGGFPHVFAGTAQPVSIGIGRVHGRLIVGRMEQSDYSPITSGPTHRLYTGLVGSFQPSAFPALELGAARVMNTRWRPGMPRLDQILRAFGGIVNDQVGSINQNEENQFASVFARLAPAGSGFEAYGEFAKEDFSGDWRWMARWPDYWSGRVIGVAQAWHAADGTLHALRLEGVNAETSHQERTGRTLIQPVPLYWHVHTLQGFTSRGQLLGSVAAYGGAGATVTWEHYGARGLDRVAVDRLLIRDWAAPLGNIGGVRHPEVRYGLRAERSRQWRGGELTIGLSPSWTLNQGLVAGRDVFNLNVQARWKGLP